MKKLVSVVVPVYNTGKYLRHCLESLAYQTLGEGLDVILVDDGSTDLSGEMCDEFATRYPEIFQVIHKENGGSASAREVGWQRATGEFITVCDSDDWVDLQMYEHMYAVAEDADMVISHMYYNYPDGSQTELRQDYGVDLNPDAIIDVVLTNNACGSTCNKLTRRELYSTHNLHWEAGINLGEDVLMLLKYLKSAKPRIKVTDKSFYHYRRRQGEDTYTNRLTSEKWQQLRRVHQWRETNLCGRKSLDAGAIDLIFAYLRLDEGKMKVREIVGRPFCVQQILSAPSPLLKRGIVLSAKFFGIRPTRFIVKKLYSLFYK